MSEENFGQFGIPKTLLGFFLAPRFLFLILFVLILIVGIVFISSKKGKTNDLQPGIEALSSLLANSSETQPILNIYRKALEDVSRKGDEQAQYKAVFNLIQGILGEYSRSHNPELRKFISEIDAFAQKTYPNYYQKSDFFVLCSDEECGQLEYKPDILEIKIEVEKTDLGLNKEAILVALYNASITSGGTTLADKNREIDNLTFALNILHVEAQAGNVKAGELETKLLNYLQKSFTNFVKPWEVTNPAVDGT